jgi:hypothetical protein
MATTMQQYEAEIAPLKRRLFADTVASGTDVLELGMGTGPNLRYYGNKVMVVCIPGCPVLAAGHMGQNMLRSLWHLLVGNSLSAVCRMCE